jgi:hypothetical protein
VMGSLEEWQRPIYELVETEKDFHRWLNMTYIHYVAPLRQKQILNEKELDVLFPNVLQLKEHSGDLIRAFNKAGDGRLKRREKSDKLFLS